jgi:formiminoglutamate deiminase
VPIVEQDIRGPDVPRDLLFDHLLLPEGWARDVRVTVAEGCVTGVQAGASRAGAEHIAGIALPGLPSLHSHAFQRGMAGLAERRGDSADSFWTWREVMYGFLGRLTPDDVESIALFAYMQMLESGFTAVGEFHYLHHDIDGAPYADLGEMATRIATAAAEAKIGLTLLPSFYAQGGFGGAAPAAGQRRFLNDPDRFAKLVDRCHTIVAALPEGRVGIAPHSLRAVTPESLRRIVDANPDGPIHIHAAEQSREVEDCMAALGARPVQWLLDEMAIDARWCVIHATHMTDDETAGLAASGAVAGLCPVTEASLGDGIFPGARYLAGGGRFGVGTDSNIAIDAAGELRQLEYSQRLAHRARNVLSDRDSVGRRLVDGALAGGAQALARPIGAIAPGCRADIVVLDAAHPDLAGRTDDLWLDAWVFVAGKPLVKTVLVGGEAVVVEGRHLGHEMIAARYRRTITRLVDA